MKLQTSKLGKVGITVEKNPWTITKSYDKLVIVRVEEQSTTYISRKEVPSGINFTNTEYWIPLSVVSNTESKDETKGVLNIEVPESTIYFNENDDNFKIKFKVKGTNIQTTKCDAEIYIDGIGGNYYEAININGDWFEVNDLFDVIVSSEKEILLIKIRVTNEKFSSNNINVAETYILCIKQNNLPKIDHVCYIIDQSADIGNPADKVSSNFIKDKSGYLIEVSKNGANGDSSTNFLKWLREHTHAYIGKYDDVEDMMYIKQLDDIEYGKFADGSNALEYIENWEHFVIENNICYNVWIKFDIDVYYRTESYEDDKILVTIASRQLDEDVWEKISKDTLIGAYKAHTYHEDPNIQCSVAHVIPTLLLDKNSIDYTKDNITPYTLVSFKLHSFIALLFYGYYGTLDAQSICGYGKGSARKTGNYEKSPMIDTIRIEDNESFNNVSFWGLENWWGDIYEVLKENIHGIGNHTVGLHTNSLVTLHNEDIIINSEDELLEHSPEVVDSNITKISDYYGERFIVFNKDIVGCIFDLHFGKHGDLNPNTVNFDYSLNYTDKTEFEYYNENNVFLRSGCGNDQDAGISTLIYKDFDSVDSPIGYRIVYHGYDNIIVVDDFN